MIEAEIQASTDSTLIRSEDGLVGYWNFDDETAKDLTVNGHDNNKLKGMPNCRFSPLTGYGEQDYQSGHQFEFDVFISPWSINRTGVSCQVFFLPVGNLILRVAQAVKWEENLKFALRWNRMF